MTTTTKPELPQALHVALLNCQAAQDARTRAMHLYLNAEMANRSKGRVSRMHQEWQQAKAVADAAFRDLGRALDAEGGHDLWRIVYLKGRGDRSRIQVRPTRESARRREGVARLTLRRRLEAMGATVQYLVALPVGMRQHAGVDGWERVRGMTFLARESFAQRPSMGAWEVLAYGQLPEPTPDPDPDVEVIQDQGEGGGLTQAHLGTPCLAKYADGWDFACTLPQGHDGQHQDAVTDAPAIVAWYATQAAWNVARHVRADYLGLRADIPAEAAYARHLAAQGRCPGCRALFGNYHQDTCPRQGVVGQFVDLGGNPRQDRPRASRTAQDGRNAPDLTDWAPGEVTESYGR